MARNKSHTSFLDYSGGVGPLGIHIAQVEMSGGLFRGRSVLVVGMGKSGVAASRFLKSKGAKVTLTDQRSRTKLKDVLKNLPRSINVMTGSFRFQTHFYDLIVVSPGVAWDHPSLKAARKKGIPIWPELELGWRMIEPFKTIAVTGTNGKTTTTALISSIVKKSGHPVVVAGNIGVPLTSQLHRISKKTILVLEVSSYQLEAHETFHPDIGVVLNLSPDHLARHKSMKNYAFAKRRLFVQATKKDVAIYNKKDPWCRWIVKNTKPRKIGFPTSPLKKLASSIGLPGAHNLENAMAAGAATLALGMSRNTIRKGLGSFRGVHHRLQRVRTQRGVTYWNDSKSTNVDSTRQALNAIPAPIVLILGGQHKGSSYKPLASLIRKKVRHLIAIGEARSRIQRDLKSVVPIHSTRSLSKAIHEIPRLVKKGTSVLLSPACASFDQYRNFEERGNHFIRLVGALKS